MFLCKNKFQYKCSLVKCNHLFHTMINTCLKNYVRQKMEINAHYFPWDINSFSRVKYPQPAAMRKRRFSLFKESECCMLACN